MESILQTHNGEIEKLQLELSSALHDMNKLKEDTRENEASFQQELAMVARSKILLVVKIFFVSHCKRIKDAIMTLKPTLRFMVDAQDLDVKVSPIIDHILHTITP